MDLRFAWVGSYSGFEPLLSGGRGTCWGDDEPAPTGWTPAASPAEAGIRADFVFVRATISSGWRALLARGIVRNAAPGACVVLCGESSENVTGIEALLDAEGFDVLDLAVLPDPCRIAVGGSRDTFNLLKPFLSDVGLAYFCGELGAGLRAASEERRLLKVETIHRPERLELILRDAEREGSYPQALRNVWKAGPLAGEAFDAEADRLTKRL